MAAKKTRATTLNAGAAPKAVSKAAASRAIRWDWWMFGAALIAVFFAYAPAVHGPFVFDDYNLLFRNPNAPVGDPHYWLTGNRLMLNATYWLNYAISGTAPETYHIFSILLHIGTAVLVFFLLERILTLAKVRQDPRLLAAFGAGLFALHPLQTESVAYIAGRSEVVAGLFYVAAWLVFLTRIREGLSWAASAAILLLTGLAVLGKESAITIPAALFVTDLYWNPAPLREQIASRLKLYVPLAIGGALAAWRILSTLSGATGAGFETPGVTPASYALTQCRAILTYIRLFILPVGQNGDWGIPMDKSLTANFTWFFVLGMAALIWLIVWSRRREKLLSYGLLIFLLLLMPTSSIVPVKDAIAERRIYVPIVGLILASIWAIERLKPRAATLRPIMAGLLLIAAVVTAHRSVDWSSDLNFWRSSIAQNPNNSRAHMGLGDAYLANGTCADAVREFQETERLEGVSDHMSTNLAAAYGCSNQTALAVKALEAIKKPDSQTYTMIGFDEALLSHADAAMVALNKAIEMNPDNATALAYRGTVFDLQGDRAAAETDLDKALKLDPGNTAVRQAMNMFQHSH